MTFHDDFSLCSPVLVKDELAHNEIHSFCISGPAGQNAVFIMALNDYFLRETGKALCQFDQIDYNDRSTRREHKEYHMWLWYGEHPGYFTITNCQYEVWLKTDPAILPMLREALERIGADNQECRIQWHTVTHDDEIDSRAYDVYQYELRDRYVTYNGMTGKIRWSKDTQKFWFVKKYARKYGYTVDPISILYNIKPA